MMRSFLSFYLISVSPPPKDAFINIKYMIPTYECLGLSNLSDSRPDFLFTAAICGERCCFVRFSSWMRTERVLFYHKTEFLWSFVWKEIFNFGAKKSIAVMMDTLLDGEWGIRSCMLGWAIRGFEVLLNATTNSGTTQVKIRRAKSSRSRNRDWMRCKSSRSNKMWESLCLKAKHMTLHSEVDFGWIDWELFWMILILLPESWKQEMGSPQDLFPLFPLQ